MSVPCFFCRVDVSSKYSHIKVVHANEILLKYKFVTHVTQVAAFEGEGRFRFLRNID